MLGIIAFCYSNPLPPARQIRTRPTTLNIAYSLRLCHPSHYPSLRLLWLHVFLSVYIAPQQTEFFFVLHLCLIRDDCDEDDDAGIRAMGPLSPTVSWIHGKADAIPFSSLTGMATLGWPVWR